MGRPAVVPPAGRGRGDGCAPLSGRWGEGRWGAFSESAEGGVDGSEIGALPGGRRGDLWTERTRSLSGGGRPRGPRRRMEALTVPMFVPAVALDHSDHALSEAKKRAN